MLPGNGASDWRCQMTSFFLPLVPCPFLLYIPFVFLSFSCFARRPADVLTESRLYSAILLPCPVFGFVRFFSCED